ncbi:DUF2335 domain-containing protein [Pseudovibrio exalbescens]|uniref:DUF2335 domain-containing protein n=1 Tax=Pseudovibrio exalbescens TaxID=197461 RepID=UPI002366E855|nr:DUF2335 domain-containing protein [Pseudovibrio exalbescens]MDD7911659.1 DUF2335 domain-containing protein [Pseudovibrio exalbescens]
MDEARRPDRKDVTRALEVLARESADSTIPKKQIAQFASKFAKKLVEHEDGSILLAQHEETRMHSGPLPSPETLAEYERVHPGLVERIIKMAELEQEEYLRSHKRQQDADNRFRLISYSGGLAALLIILATGAGLAYLGHDAVAGVLFGATFAGVIGYFVNAYKAGG